MTKVYLYTCPHCKDAPRRGQWRRSWRWKTERGFLNHRCYADETPSVPQVLYHHDRENGKRPFWLTGDRFPCPRCRAPIPYSSVRNPGLHFACPYCAAEVQWQRGGSREVAVLTRVCESRDVCELVAFVAAEEFGDPAKVAPVCHRQAAGGMAEEGGEEGGAFQSETVIGIDFERKSSIMGM